MESKEAYKKVFIDEVDTSFVKTSKSLETGTMVDKFILTPDEFHNEYAFPVGSGNKPDLEAECLKRNIPINKGDTKEIIQAKLFGNKEVLTAGEYEMLMGIEKEVKRQPLFDFDGNYEKQKELVVEYKGVKLKGTLDRLDTEKGLIRDLKTTSDLEYNPYYGVTRFENSLMNNDEYKYGLQLARYRVLCKINYGKSFSGVLDAVKTTGNYAYEAYMYRTEVLEAIALHVLFPALDDLIEDTKNNSFMDKIENRAKLIDNRYYPILDCALQKEFRLIEPTFYT